MQIQITILMCYKMLAYCGWALETMSSLTLSDVAALKPSAL